MLKRILFLMLLGSSFAAFAQQGRVDVSNFAKEGLSGWEDKSFSGEALYSLIEDEGRQVLLAESTASASGKGRRIEIDLTETPYINWSWKLIKGLPTLDEKSKDGDDYAARLYIVKSGGALIWKTKALNYVWSASQDREASWPNAYKPKNAMMLAARGQTDSDGVWVTEKRNVREDFKKLFGKDITSIDAVAIMTDTDNSGLAASAVYGDIFFTAD